MDWGKGSLSGISRQPASVPTGHALRGVRLRDNRNQTCRLGHADAGRLACRRRGTGKLRRGDGEILIRVGVKTLDSERVECLAFDHEILSRIDAPTGVTT